VDTEHRTSSDPHVIGVIPSRWGSTRFPGKPLHLISGKPLVQHVWDQCQKCEHLDSVVIATDDERIKKTCKAFGAEVIITSPDHPTGSDRIAEVLAKSPTATHAVNIQGDEPLIDPALIDSLAQLMRDDLSLEMATAASPLTEEKDITDPNVVKVVLNDASDALYFSRSPIPYQRTSPDELIVYRHIGIYAYRRDFLEKFLAWEPSILEKTESLEQLRALSNGTRIQVSVTDHVAPGVDTPEQAAYIEHLLQHHPESPLTQ